jgi:integrase
MTMVDLPYLTRQRDRQGRWLWYFRRRPGAPKARLPGEPGSPEFLEAYHAAVRSPRAVAAPTARTWRWLCTLYLASPEFTALGPSTRAQRRRVLESTWREPVAPQSPLTIGETPLDRFTRGAVRVLRDRKAAVPEAANHRLKAVRRVFAWGIDVEHFDGANPALGVRPLRGRPGGFHTWSVAEVERYRNRHPVGTKARLALELLLFTGVRRSDLVRLGHPLARDGWLHWTETKGRARAPKERSIPILPELQAVLAATPVLGVATWLVSHHGRPFTTGGFGNWFRERCNEAGLPHCSAHGLRKAGATIAANNGATLHQLMAVFGWETSEQALVYTKRADRKKLAQEAMGLLVAAPEHE